VNVGAAPLGGGAQPTCGTPAAAVLHSRGPGRESVSSASPYRIRAASFAALGLYGVLRWGVLLRPDPQGRLLAVLGVAVALVVLAPVARRVGAPVAFLAALVLALLVLPAAGLPWSEFIHLRVAVAVREIGAGCSGLPGSLVPYEGTSAALRLVIVLGAGVLLTDAAIVLAFAPRQMGELRRLAAALPLVALAVVPSTLVRPQQPYLQGLILFALLAGFLWAERLRGVVLPGLILLAAAGLAGALLAPRLDRHHALLDYRAWASGLAAAPVTEFDWSQSYGPLRWPHQGRIVLTVSADRPDYWKSEDLDVFDGYGWVDAPAGGAALPQPAAAAVERWSQTVSVHLTAMRSSQIIAAGYAQPPGLVQSDVRPGPAPGTLVADQELPVGTSYSVQTYSPRPDAAQLAAAARQPYPDADLAAYRRLELPLVGSRLPTSLTFDAFGSSGTPSEAGLLSHSVYAPVYALARRLSAGAASPFAYLRAVLRYLGHGYGYSLNPPTRTVPLVSFLLQDRIGYCQQFAGAAALLLRMGGVPARVAAGFTTGLPDGPHAWTVTDTDAHAWVEVWFPRYGWVRFDPTPAGSSTASSEPSLPRVGATSEGAGSLRTAPRAQAPASAPQPSGPVPARGASPPWLALALAALLAGAAGAGFLLLHRRGPVTPEARVRELERGLSRTGRSLETGATLRSLEHRFRDAPQAAAYIRALRMARYAPEPLALPPGGRRAVRARLRQGLGVIGWARALWALPPRPRA
jgi:transglutaminase-like putative cysteine protease